MFKPEQKVYQKLKVILGGIPGLWFDRLESRVSKRGLPDVLLQLSQTLFIETKTGKLHAESLEVDKWTAEQRRWAWRSWRSGTPVWIVVGVGDNFGTLLMFPGNCIDAQNMPVSNTRVPLHHCAFVNAAEIRNILGIVPKSKACFN